MSQNLYQITNSISRRQFGRQDQRKDKRKFKLVSSLEITHSGEDVRYRVMSHSVTKLVRWRKPLFLRKLQVMR